jgi:putative oxidoreductase
MRMRPVHDVAALLARTGVGVVFVYHGWQKIQVGIDATSHKFHGLKVPLPTAAAIYSTFVELLGGVAMVLGLALPVAGGLLFLDMLGAFVFVNGSHGLMIDGKGTTPAHQGFELVLVLGLASLLFAAGGGGRLTLDRYLVARRTGRHDPDDGWHERLRPEAAASPGDPTLPIPRPASEIISGDPPAPGPGGFGEPTQDVLVVGRRGTEPPPATPALEE